MTQDTAHDALTVEGAVCPQCFKPLKAPSITPGGDDPYGRRTRSYAGFCFDCRTGCRVVQFERDGRWAINSYQPHRYENGAFIGVGDWIVVNPLPEPPLLTTGPGGDYTKHYTEDDIDRAIEQLLDGAWRMLTNTAETLGGILKFVREKRSPNGK